MSLEELNAAQRSSGDQSPTLAELQGALRVIEFWQDKVAPQTIGVGGIQLVKDLLEGIEIALSQVRSEIQSTRVNDWRPPNREEQLADEDLEQGCETGEDKHDPENDPQEPGDRLPGQAWGL